MKTDDLLSILDQELVPSVDLGRLVDKHLLKVFELHGPLVDVFLELSECQTGASGGGARCVSHAGQTSLGCSSSQSQP